MITAPRIIADFLSNTMSFISSLSFSCCNLSRFSGFCFSSFLNIILKSKNEKASVIIISGVICHAKSINEILAAEPIIMFGGSPISVVAPPIFDANISARIKKTGLMFRIFATEIVTGTIRRTIVTLSRNAEPTAVMTESKISNFQIFPPDAFAAFMPMYWNIPVSPSTPTISIIPNSKPIVLKSIDPITKSTVSCGSSTPTENRTITIINAPTKASEVR